MAVKNSRKIYVVNNVYHVYNRGVERRVIFTNDRDYNTFLYFLKYYLLDPKLLEKEFPNKQFVNNLHYEISLLSFCLMPNHFHLLVKQNTLNGMSKLMQRVAVSYSGYFNRTHNRKGTLFEGVYKAVSADTSLEILKVSRYINLNPIIEKVDDDYQIVPGKRLNEAINYPYSSLSCILDKKVCAWLNKDLLLENLKQCPAYNKRTYLEFLKSSETGGTFVDF